MTHPKPRTAVLAATVAALLAAGLSACTSEEAVEVTAEDFDRLANMVNESRRLSRDLEAAELRVILDCMERQGFEIHDQFVVTSWVPDEAADSVVDYYPFDQFIFEREAAERWGWGQWTLSADPEDDEAREFHDWKSLRRSDQVVISSDDVDNGPFDELSGQEQFAWYVAYYGEPIAFDRYGYLSVGEQEWMTEIEAGDEDDEDIAPAPDGCTKTMIEAVYGEPTQLGSEGGSQWFESHPPDPAQSFNYSAIQREYRSRTSEVEGLFLGCIKDAGHGEWDFTSRGTVHVEGYWDEVHTGYEGDTGYPAPPEDLPSDLGELKAIEIDMALDFLDCADTTGYLETATEAWETVNAERFLEAEPEIFQWHEDMRGYLEDAQEVLNA